MPHPDGPCVGWGGAPAQEEHLGYPDQREEPDAHDRGHDDGGPELRRARDVELVEIEDRAAEPIANARRQLADDRADDARGRRDFERREEIGRGSRQSHLDQDVAR